MSKYHEDVELEILSQNEAIIKSKEPGLLMVDISEDLKSWARIKTEFIEGEYKFELPKPNPSKLFIRSGLMKF